MQPWIAKAPAVFVVAGDPSRIGTSPQALALTFYEGGAAAQNLLLQAQALGLGAGTAVGVDLDAVGKALKLPAGVQILALLPVGRAAKP
jgi:nitroreductase